MSTHRSTLGSCPVCGDAVTEYDVVIEYETTDGPGVWAECPGCLDIVDPT